MAALERPRSARISSETADQIVDVSMGAKSTLGELLLGIEGLEKA